jgi:hypothetical protein
MQPSKPQGDHGFQWFSCPGFAKDDYLYFPNGPVHHLFFVEGLKQIRDVCFCFIFSENACTIIPPASKRGSRGSTCRNRNLA